MIVVLWKLQFSGEAFVAAAVFAAASNLFLTSQFLHCVGFTQFSIFNTRSAFALFSPMKIICLIGTQNIMKDCAVHKMEMNFANVKQHTASIQMKTIHENPLFES